MSAEVRAVEDIVDGWITAAQLRTAAGNSRADAGFRCNTGYELNMTGSADICQGQTMRFVLSRACEHVVVLK
jgi:hypothetical protein